MTSAARADRQARTTTRPAARRTRPAHLLQDGRRHRAGGRRRLVSSSAGETLGVVGESGSGKSVTMMSILGLNPKPGRLDACRAGRRPARRWTRSSTRRRSTRRSRPGAALFRGENLLRASASRLRSLRGSEISMIFQDPMTSLNPVLTSATSSSRRCCSTATSPRARRASSRSPVLEKSASRARSGASTTTRTSSRAACASA